MTYVGWLILLLHRVGWDVMGCESEPLPNYHELRNCSYYIKLSYITSSSTHQVHLSHPGPNIAPTISSPASAPPPCTAHRWGGRPSFMPCSPDTSWCPTRWGGPPRLPLPPLPRGNTNLCLPLVSPLSRWSVAPPSGGTPPGPWESPPSPPRSSCRTRVPTEPPPYTCELNVQCCMKQFLWYNWGVHIIYLKIYPLITTSLKRSDCT